MTCHHVIWICNIPSPKVTTGLKLGHSARLAHDFEIKRLPGTVEGDCDHG